MKRIAIVLDKNLNAGEVGNVSAILMGDLASKQPDIFFEEKLNDLSQAPHATIKYSTVVLKSGSLALLNFVDRLHTNEEVSFVLFSRTGQKLNNAYEQYKEKIATSSSSELEPIGVAVFGEDAIVRELTKKFSLLK
ncbi:DUF2000 domain-containing protein [Candidatus Enterococcus willemsii]|uniref:DUF2000 domain-containing protein n=1 Tax=Candidatus Enterococcus willemsii TaxID=1857215 RepID=A0ABQ6Z110_9ENTE|nr:DUF2000 domain-containing protein [Enterococcus sp. CU12B]KAF1305068.1 hypothetical protein BAU17_05185 [Enterococcus sp. CU12B]